MRYIVSIRHFLTLIAVRKDGLHLLDGSVDALEGEAGVEGLDDEDLVTKALRANFCPNCVLNIILVDALIVSSLD